MTAGVYALPGPQVDPEASYWNNCPVPCPVSHGELVAITDVAQNSCYFPDYPTNAAVVQAEFDELQMLEGLRKDPTAIASTDPDSLRCEISAFLQLRPPPLGAVTNTARGDAFPVVSTGAELARYFENETPGLAHRQALNYLIRNTNWSPPRQALVWAALDVAIYSAMCAAWYYKWLSPRANVSRRERPIEYATDNVLPLDVLYDRAVNSTGSGSNGLRLNPSPSPGTPRHPAYPSGHSTYSGAASEMLSFFFPDYRREFDRLADNAGMARLWAGIHWRSDHVNGMELGRCVAGLIIDQLRDTSIPLVPAGPPDQTPPSIATIQADAAQYSPACGPAPSPKPGPSCPVSTPWA
ncbi:MAG: vanadium-dependent haloperoxidase [Rubrobacteraceae bacterium]|nr:vanadium-dependent haloperoxidase [Rubrobacteraceae bacterium]